jgi:opacity protein-like surface antigen
MLYMKTSKLLVAAVIGGILCGTAAAADDSVVGAYLGVGIGTANVRVDERPGNIALGLKEHHSSWKVFAGLRPISLLGVELSYVELGRAEATLGPPNSASTVIAQARQSGGSIYAVGYLPLPVPLFDIYAKAGTTRMETNLDGYLPGLQCVATGCNEFHDNGARTSFTWGAGAQLKLPLTGLSARAEYERFNIPNGAPDLVSVSLLWRL